MRRRQYRLEEPRIRRSSERPRPHRSGVGQSCQGRRIRAAHRSLMRMLDRAEQRSVRNRRRSSGCARAQCARPNARRRDRRQTGHALAPECVYRHATAVGRKSRAKRGRWNPPVSSSPTRTAAAPKRSYAGARVARVAVDDETWEAFRAACGSTPASVRLGQLVEADVQRAEDSAGADARSTLQEVRERLAALEQFLAP